MLAWPLLSLVAFACHLNLEYACIRIGGESERYKTHPRIATYTDVERERMTEELNKAWKAYAQKLRSKIRRILIKRGRSPNSTIATTTEAIDNSR